MSIFEDRELKKQDESDLTSMNNKGVVINRGTLRLSIGGIYKKQDSDEEYQLIEFVDANQAFFKNLKTLKVQVLSIHQFENVHDADHAVMRLDIDAISDKEWERAQAKHAAIEPILRYDDDYDGYAGLERRAQECGVSVRTLQRWLASYVKTNSIASLIDKKRGWQEGRRRIDVVQELIIDEVIQDYYLTIQRPTIQATIQEVFKRCHLSGVKKPSKNAIRYQIGKIDEKEYLKARGYRSRAKNKFTPKVGSFPNVNAPLSVIQIDHTPADIILVDDKHRKPIGRPYITVAIDIYSRMITGYYISLDAPSVTSVGMCLTRSILPKEELLLSHGIQDVTWDVFGIPKKIHVDNGSDFRAESLKRSCSLYGIDIEFRPLARPEYGGHIERIIGNLMHEVHKLPGTTFSNIRQKDGYDSEKHASLTLGEFETWFLTYITKVYHQKPHSALGCSPAHQWRIGIFGDDEHEGIGIPSIPTSPQTLVLDFMPSVERTIQHTGVTIDGLQYYDTILNSYINTTDNKTDKKRKFIFRQDPRDISMVWFFDPNIKQYFKIPCANQAFPPMSIWEYNQLKKQVKQRSGTVNESLIYQAWEEMRTMIDAAQSTTKTARRQAQRRKTHIHEKFRHIAHLSDKERLEFIGSPRWIGYTAANKAIDIMQGLMNTVRQHRMPNLLIIGESNNGKTTILNQFSRKFGDTYLEDDLDLVIPVVFIQAPPASTEKDLYIALLATFALPIKMSDSASALRYQVIHAFRQCRVKILIIDEIHSLLSGTARQQRQIMNCIKFLCNELQIPIVLSGTPDAVRVLHTDPQHISRFDVLPIPIWQNDGEFKRLVGSFERILPLKEPSNLTEPEKLNLIYSITDGRIGNVRRLLNECAIDAIKQGKETISVEMIKGKSWLRPTLGLRNLM